MTVAERNEVSLMYRHLRKSTITCAEWCEFIEEQRLIHGDDRFKIELHSVIRKSDAAKKRLKTYKESPLFQFRIRKFCNYRGYSDTDPYEVVRVISPRKIEIREMEARLVTAPIQHIGGFCANTENDTQEWAMTSNEAYPLKTITLTKNGWGEGHFQMSDKSVKIYDYNF